MMADIDKADFDVVVNDTYGVNTIWRAHPINAPITLKAGETGALEITFFLN